ncbi:MAG: type II secretion system protein [Deltaproteobacteria bacterium]|nr:type II secretion system protein [Deltaproteobacteria bacterium]
MNGRQGSYGKAGFTYLAVLFAITLMGFILSRTGVAHRSAAQMAKEEELIFRGLEIKRAIGAYHRENNRYPSRLKDLVKDPGFPYTKRYLRRLYTDPFTGRADWEIIESPQTGIMGVRSRASGAPFKKTGFPPELKGLEGMKRYGDWEFAYDGGSPQASD